MARRKTDKPKVDEELLAEVEATDPIHQPAPEIAAIPEAEVIEATAEPAPEDVAEVVSDTPAPDAPEPAAPPAPKAKGAFLPFAAALIGGAVAAAGGFALGRYTAPDITAIETQIAALQSAPEADPALADRIAKLEQTLAAPAGDDPRFADLTARLAALEAAPVPADVSSQIAALQADLAKIKAAGGTIPADVTAAAAAAEERLRAAETAAADLAAKAAADAAAARRAAAIDRVAAALDSGAPYSASLAELGGDLPVVLTDHATTGLPTLPELEDSFAPAARLALDAALRENMGEGWSERATNFLRSQVGLRSLSPQSGDDPDAILSRAEAALKTGALADVLAELAKLPAVSQPPLADWIASATLRHDAELAVADLLATK